MCVFPVGRERDCTRMGGQYTTWIKEITFVHPTTGEVTMGYIVLPNIFDLDDTWTLCDAIVEFQRILLHIFTEETDAQLVAHAADSGEKGVQRSYGVIDLKIENTLRVESDRDGNSVVTANMPVTQGVATRQQIFGDWHTSNMSTKAIVQAASIAFAKQTISVQSRHILAALDLTESSGTHSSASASLQACARRLEYEADCLGRALESSGSDSSVRRRSVTRADRREHIRSRSPARAAAASQHSDRRAYGRRRRSRSPERD